MNDNFNDHFMDHPGEVQEQVHQETPQEREEREIEESIIERRHNPIRMTILAVIVFLACVLVTWTWLHYFRPYAHSVEKGWVMNVTNEGTVFKTIECKMLTQDYIMDSVKVQWKGDTVLVDGANFACSLANDSLVHQAVRFKGSGQRVVVEYDEYKGSLPWRGNTTRVATSIELDSAYVENFQ